MKKESWINKPITWGGYLTLAGIATLMGVLVSVVTYAAYFTTWLDNLKLNIFRIGKSE